MGRRINVVDGLDGGGKTSITSEIKRIYEDLGYNTVIVHFPQYTTPWGKEIRDLLDTGDKGLTLLERMVVYALNRLECVDTIKEQVSRLEGSSVLLFDRFPTSNVLTLAYYLAAGSLENASEEDVSKWIEQNSDEIDYYVSIITEIDCAFMRALNIEDAEVYVPTIDPAISLARIANDASRLNGGDTYENYQVQMIAYHLYKTIAEAGLLNIKIVEQDGRDPSTIAKDIVNRSGLLDSGTVEKPTSVRVKVGEDPYISPSIQTEMQRLITRFPKLRNLQIGDKIES